jgi:hypothetical protein
MTTRPLLVAPARPRAPAREGPPVTAPDSFIEDTRDVTDMDRSTWRRGAPDARARTERFLQRVQGRDQRAPRLQLAATHSRAQP